MPDLPGGETADQLAEKVLRPNEEAERRALIWLMDVRTHGGPIDRRYAASMIETLAWFEAEHAALLARLAEAENRRMIARSDADGFKSRLAEAEKERDNARRRSEQLAGVIAKRTALMQAAEAERDRLRAALEEIGANAQSWHGPEPPDSGHVRALHVIGDWCRAALAADEAGDGE